jgi:hypothetical protein
MIYNIEKLRKKLLLPIVTEWIAENAIDKKYIPLLTQMQNDAYKPSQIAFRVGLFLLTFILAFCSGGLIALFFGFTSSSMAFGMICCFFSILSFVAAYYFINTKLHYKTGVDTALYYFSIISLMFGIGLMLDNLWNSTSTLVIFCMFCSGLLMIYAFLFFDFLLAMIAILIFATGYANAFYETTAIIKLCASLLFPFVCFAFYKTVIYLEYKMDVVYQNIFPYCKFMLAVVAYIALNRSFVNEVFFEYTLQYLKKNVFAAFSIFSVVWSWLLPLVYIFYGLYKNERSFLLAGISCMALFICSIPYFHPSAIPEVMMLTGSVACFIFVGLSNYFFKNHAWKITLQKSKYDSAILSKEMQGIIMSQALKIKTISQDTTEFGGGEFGGGGGSDEY